MKISFPHLPQLSYKARIRRNMIMIWSFIVLLIGLYLSMHRYVDNHPNWFMDLLTAILPN